MNQVIRNHRKNLNEEQLEVLELLYRFRFGSNDLFAQYFGKRDRSFVYKRLSILLDQGLIGKRFDSSYRLQGKPAAYYLLPEGARRLQASRDIDVNIKAIYKDKAVSEQFVDSSLQLFALYNRLRAEYGDALSFFTKADMNHEAYDYFPRPLPDAYLRLGDSQHFFLNVFRDDEPYFVAKRRVKQYVQYHEDADWSVTESSFPIVLAVCESLPLAKRVQKHMAKGLDDAWTDEEPVFALATTNELMGNEPAAWQRADNPEVRLTLQNLS